jgi:hypothetical protein
MRNKSRWLIESGILDLAAAILMIRWIRRRDEAQSLGGFDGYSSDDKWRKVVIVVDLIRRLVGSQAFFVLALALANEESWLGRNLRAVWSLIAHRPPKQTVAMIRKERYGNGVRIFY